MIRFAPAAIRGAFLGSLLATSFTASAPALAQSPGPESTPPNWPDCSREIAMPPRREGAPVDDFDGLRLGIRLDDALAHVACAERRRDPVGRADSRFLAQVNTLTLPRYSDLPVDNYLGQRVRTLTGMSVGLASTGRPRFNSSRDLFELLRDQMRSAFVEWSFASFGSVGQEQLYAFTRSEGFPEDKRPRITALLQVARDKYGEPHLQEDGQGATEYRWSFTAAGIPSPANARCNAPLYWTQHHDAVRQYDLEAKRGCGVAIWLRVAKAPDLVNAHSFQVGIRNSSLFDNQKLLNVLKLWLDAQANAMRSSAPPPKF